MVRLCYSFNPWDAIYEGTPRAPRAGHRGPTPDHAGDAGRQRAAGAPGEVRRDLPGSRVGELTMFEASQHEWVARPGPQTDRARQMVKAFIARQIQIQA